MSKENMRAYNLIKSSYKGEGICFLPGVSYFNSIKIEEIMDTIRREITMDNIKKVWITQNDKDPNIFYDTYTDAFEKDFYHGWAILVMDFKTSATNHLTKNNYPEDYDYIISGIKSIIENRKEV